MPMAKTRRGRLRQIECWLRHKFPTPFKTYVRVESLPQIGPGKMDGETYRRDNGTIVVRISNKLTWHPAIECLIHEWAHALVWREDHIEYRRRTPHDEEWAVAYGRIYRRYNDQGGAKESRTYPSN